MAEVRIDKWLWAARIYKTRSIATEACKKGKISIAGNKLKPSRMIKEGDIIEVRKAPIMWSFKVLKSIQNRVGAKLLPEILENVTTKDQLEALELSKLASESGRERGTGRPTKKDRRNLIDFTDNYGFDFDSDNDE